MPGVTAAISGQEMAAEGVGAITSAALITGRNGLPMFNTKMPVLAAERVRFVGEPVVLIIADTPPQALDATEKVEVVFDHLPAVNPTSPARWLLMRR